MPLVVTMEGKPPTDRQLVIYSFIRTYIVKNDRPPAIRDICDHLSISSPNGAMCHVRGLLKRGLLKPIYHHSRRGRRRTQYIPAWTEVVSEAVNETHVRIATTGPLVMPKSEYVKWLREQIAVYEVSV
jgi:SOS-response transcriptional repressor LexA